MIKRLARPFRLDAALNTRGLPISFFAASIAFIHRIAKHHRRNLTKSSPPEIALMAHHHSASSVSS